MCDSNVSRYFFGQLSPELLQLSGNDFHKRENLFDLVHEQSSRASLIVPISQLIGYRLPTRSEICQRMLDLHITGRFELNADKSMWISLSTPDNTVVASPFNNMLIESINHVHASDSTLSVRKLLEAINQKFKQIPDINQHATSLVADMVLSGMVHIRSQRHNGFLHRPQMQALHRWRLQHNPYLTPANKWLQPISEQDLTTAQAASTAQAQPDP